MTFNKLFEEKIKKAQSNNKPIGKESHTRLPSGQTLTEKFPVLDLGITPEVSLNDWTLKIFGEVTHELEFNYENLESEFDIVEDVSDFHCVTHWSKFDLKWKGFRPRDLLKLATPLEHAKFITFHSYDDYTTNLPLDVILDDDVLLAFEFDDQPLTKEHGGPVRVVVPKRYAWKSAKWIKSIELHNEDRPGFWEERGYHNDADPWLEQRYSK